MCNRANVQVPLPSSTRERGVRLVLYTAGGRIYVVWMIDETEFRSERSRERCLRTYDSLFPQIQDSHEKDLGTVAYIDTNVWTHN